MLNCYSFGTTGVIKCLKWNKTEIGFNIVSLLPLSIKKIFMETFFTNSNFRQVDISTTKYKALTVKKETKGHVATTGIKLMFIRQWSLWIFVFERYQNQIRSDHILSIREVSSKKNGHTCFVDMTDLLTA